ncbi:MAG: hypothetical protein LBB28_04865, partial [Synergistaceae bacterium]|nr:hypothetical protein [Synergistaceae bacterium]
MSVLVFKDATLLDCVGGEPRYPVSVVIEGNVIKDVADGRAPVTCAAETVDCCGRTLMPGL